MPNERSNWRWTWNDALVWKRGMCTNKRGMTFWEKIKCKTSPVLLFTNLFRSHNSMAEIFSFFLGDTSYLAYNMHLSEWFVWRYHQILKLSTTLYTHSHMFCIVNKFWSTHWYIFIFNFFLLSFVFACFSECVHRLFIFGP